MSSSDSPDCLSCGACCGVADALKLEPHELELLSFSQRRQDGQPVRFVNGRCEALEGTIGQHVFCSGYEQRPDFCRNFECGGNLCHAIRKLSKLE